MLACLCVCESCSCSWLNGNNCSYLKNQIQRHFFFWTVKNVVHFGLYTFFFWLFSCYYWFFPVHTINNGIPCLHCWWLKAWRTVEGWRISTKYSSTFYVVVCCVCVCVVCMRHCSNATAVCCNGCQTAVNWSYASRRGMVDVCAINIACWFGPRPKWTSFTTHTQRTHKYCRK